MPIFNLYDHFSFILKILWFLDWDEICSPSDHFYFVYSIYSETLMFNLSGSVLFQKKLTTLDIAANRIKKIENISHLTELKEFWVSLVLLKI